MQDEEGFYVDFDSRSLASQFASSVHGSTGLEVRTVQDQTLAALAIPSWGYQRTGAR
jgi:hypothetical protein